MANSRTLIQQAIAELTDSDAPDLDARWLLAHLLQIDHRDPRLRQDFSVEEGIANDFRRQVMRRSKGEPLAHILGEWEFYGHTFEVTPDVLVPRPETELLVDWALQLLESQRQPRVAEIGVGSLAVLASLAIERPDLHGVGVEVSADALAVAQRNLERHGLHDRLQLREGSHYQPLEGAFDLIVANPPYISPDDPELQPSVAAHEPEIALIDHIDGDGLGHYRVLITELRGRVDDDGGLLLECGHGQADAIEELARQKGWSVEIRQDLASIPRALYLHSGDR